MSACPTTAGSGRSPYCWMAGTTTSYLRSGGNGDCSGAANGGGSCKFGSCQFDRAPDPYKEFLKTCDYKNPKMLRQLENQCSAKGFSFDSWVQAYTTARDIYSKFQPCTGQLIGGCTDTTIAELAKHTMAAKSTVLKEGLTLPQISIAVTRQGIPNWNC